MIWPFTRKHPKSNIGRATIAALTGEGRFELLGEGHEAYQRNDFQSALAIWQPMAELGDVIARYCLSVMYAKGQGVSQDFGEAIGWFEKAVGHAASWYLKQYNLGNSYAEGQDVPQNLFLAYIYFELASAHGGSDAIANRDAIAATLTPDQIVEAQQVAREFKLTEVSARFVISCTVTRTNRELRLGFLWRAVEHLRSAGAAMPQRSSAPAPLGWNHISLTGDYLWRGANIPNDGFCPLNTIDEAA
jgi:hypothetical protein